MVTGKWADLRVLNPNQMERSIEKGLDSTAEILKGSRADCSGTWNWSKGSGQKIRWSEKQSDPSGPLPTLYTVLGIHPLLQQDRGSGCLFSEEDKAESLSLL